MLSVFFYLDTNLKKYSLINAVTLMRGGGVIPYIIELLYFYTNLSILVSVILKSNQQTKKCIIKSTMHLKQAHGMRQ